MHDLRSFTILAVLALSSSASAFDIVINNGGAPPDPANLIEVGDSYDSFDAVHIQNVGCDVTQQWPCVGPGAPTAVEMVSGTHSTVFVARETSTLAVSGGWASGLRAHDDAVIAMTAGESGGNIVLNERAHLARTNGTSGAILAWDSSTVDMSGGIAGEIYVDDAATATLTGGRIIKNPFYASARLLARHDNARIYLHGRDFEVDGQPVPYGEIAAQSGTLSGFLASGHVVDNEFWHAGFVHESSGAYEGHIILVEAPSPPLPVLGPAARFALVVGLIGIIAVSGLAVPTRA